MEASAIMNNNNEHICYRLLASSWILPGMPLVFSGFYLILSAIEEPFRPDLAVAAFISLLFALLMTILVATSRLIVEDDRLDIRHYGIRKTVCLRGLIAAYIKPGTFSKQIIIRDQYGSIASVHLGYWRMERQFLSVLREYIQAAGADCSTGCAKLLRTEAKGDIKDIPRPGLLEPFLILTWILCSIALSPLVGLLLTSYL